MGGRNDDGGGRPAVRGWWLDGVLPHPSPPLWIPAFAGMTKWGAGMTKWGAGMTMVGGRPAVRCLTPHRPSGFRPSPNDEVGGRNDEVGAGLLSVVGGWG